jgi:hypothetical protein
MRSLVETALPELVGSGSEPESDSGRGILSNAFYMNENLRATH